MADISQLEGRISAALDRIRQGVEGMDRAPVGEGDAAQARIAELEAALAEEKTATAQLEERIKALKDKQESQIADLEAQAGDYRAANGALDGEIQRLTAANAELRDLNAQMSKAMAEEVAEPHLVNRAMMAELEALRAARAAEASEVGAVLADLNAALGKEA